jgi:hypothetical protein
MVVDIFPFLVTDVTKGVFQSSLICTVVVVTPMETRQRPPSNWICPLVGEKSVHSKDELC